MTDKTIIIACPVRDRAWILPYYLDHIYNLDYPKHLISILWILNQSTDESESILRAFQSKHKNEYNNIKIENCDGGKRVPKDLRIASIRQNHTYSHLATLRNLILKKARKYDYLFSCDCDILPPSNCLRLLLQHDKDVVASVIFNGYEYDPKSPWKYPNILKVLTDGKVEHIANSYIKNSPTSKQSQIHKADIVGAISLMTNLVTQHGHYSFHKQGEDVSFCINLKNKGFELWYDSGCYSQHIMNSEMIQTYLGETDEEKNNSISTNT